MNSYQVPRHNAPMACTPKCHSIQANIPRSRCFVSCQAFKAHLPACASTQHSTSCRSVGSEAQASSSTSHPGSAHAIATLKEAARARAVPREQVKAALEVIEREGPSEQDWQAIVSQPSPAEGGRRAWRTVYTQNASANRWRERLLPGSRTQEQQLGSFFLGTFINTFVAASGEFSMSVHSGHWAFLKLVGPYRFRGNMMTFDIKSAQVGLFPFKFGLPLHLAGPSEGRSNGFKYLYADSEIVVARGARGGIALLARATPSWLLEHGVA